MHAALSVNAILSEVLSEWRTIQEQHRGMKVFAARGLKFCRSEYVFAGPGGEPYTNQSFNAHLGRACKDLRLQTILTAHGLRHSAATILLNDQGKNLREVQEALRHRDIRTTARYTHVAPEHIRIVKWFSRQQLAILDSSRTKVRDDLQERIIMSLTGKTGGVTVRELHRGPLRDLSAAAIQQGISGLGPRIIGDEIHPPSGGHPTLRYWLTLPGVR